MPMGAREVGKEKEINGRKGRGQGSPGLLDTESGAMTVGEFVAMARRAIESSLSNLVVEGELGRFDRYPSGHCYFMLKDESAQLSCVMFRRQALGLERLPKVGDHVRIEGAGSVYEPRGQLQFIAVALKPAGRGGLYEQFLRLKAKLQEEGLFDRARKRPIPRWPGCVGVVTSTEGAAVQDVLRTLRKRMPMVPVVIYPTLTQGEQAPARIVAAIEAASRRAECDTLILCRGGGSMEDLWAYNSEAVARAVAACPIPVVTGIGHEIDETIADHVADERTPTPTAAAARSVPDRVEVLRHLETQVRRLAGRVADQLDRRSQRLDYASRRLRHPRQVLEQHKGALRGCASRLLHAPRRRVLAAGDRVDTLQRLLAREGLGIGARGKDLGGLERRLALGAKAALATLVSRLGNSQARLSVLDHRKTMARGFSLVWDAAGSLVRDAEVVDAGDRVRIQFAKGGAEAEVKGRVAADGD